IAYYPIDRIADEWWQPAHYFSIVVRTRSSNALGPAEPIRRAVAALDPNVAVANVRTMTQVVAESTARASFAMMLLGIAAGIALILGTVGLYGVISSVVGQRRKEVGLRMALGARMEEVALLVVRRSLCLALIGIVIGIAGTLAATRVLASLLFETSATDPLTLAGVSLLLLATAALASWIPARRAARVEPMEVLRVE
ncbi:MAG: FtsX-like permease family protein, partial [Longimicrobiales bacterium]